MTKSTKAAADPVGDWRRYDNAALAALRWRR
jgi:hypothetical protein